MTYEETIDYLYHRLPMFSRIGSTAIKPDLTNTLKLCEKLDNPQHQFPSIHIAGTNGKGSTSHMLAAILQKAGYKTGLYTSPHLRDFRERIRINGEMIPQKNVIDFVASVTGAINDIEPSFFELTVAMAFDYFRNEQTDITIIEAGLGGRLDSTNVITPLISVITSIGWDHMNILGNSIEQIAFEKAGIIKRGIPVVTGPIVYPEAKEVIIQKAKAQHAELSDAGKRYRIKQLLTETDSLQVTLYDEIRKADKTFTLDLPGEYQQLNLPTVLLTCEKIAEQGWAISESVIHDALQQVRLLTGLSGRCETIHTSPRVVLDVAHNEDGMRALMEQFNMEDNADSRLHLIIGMVKDKEVDKILKLLPRHAVFYFTKAQIPRALPETELKTKAAAIGIAGAAFENVNDALDTALKQAAINDTILVCGSVFVVGEVDPITILQA
jgi:dihydrofolate synthase/folylpolyglutamate synthase